MVKAREVNLGGEIGHLIVCPGCDELHTIDSRWQFNGDCESPTFSPSLLVRFPWGEDKEMRVCHSFIEGGMIRFLSDCTHALAGQTVELQDVTEWQEARR